MALNGASQHFKALDDPNGKLTAEKLNSLNMGGNVYQSPVGGLKVNVSPIRGLIDDVEIDYAGVDEQSLTPSSTLNIWIDDAGVLQVSAASFPTYPGTRYFPLATVVTSGAGITSITDKRWKFFA